MGKRRKTAKKPKCGVEFYKENRLSGFRWKSWWTFNIPWKRQHHKTELGAKREFLRAAAVVAKEADRVREEVKRG